MNLIVENGFSNIADAIYKLREIDEKNYDEYNQNISEVISDQDLTGQHQLDSSKRLFDLHLKNLKKENVEKNRRKAVMKVNKK